MCLCFRGVELILEGYTNVNMIGDLDNKKSTSRYAFTFVKELYHGSLSCKNVLPYLQLEQNILLQLK